MLTTTGPSGYSTFPDDDLDGHQADPRLRLYGSAAGVVLWARGLADLRNNTGRHPPYVGARPNFASLLDAARYASNHAVQQLIPLSDLARGGRSYPMSFPLVFRAPTLRWAPECALSPGRGGPNRQAPPRLPHHLGRQRDARAAPRMVRPAAHLTRRPIVGITANSSAATGMPTAR